MAKEGTPTVWEARGKGRDKEREEHKNARGVDSDGKGKRGIKEKRGIYFKACNCGLKSCVTGYSVSFSLSTCVSGVFASRVSLVALKISLLGMSPQVRCIESPVRR